MTDALLSFIIHIYDNYIDSENPSNFRNLNVEDKKSFYTIL